MTAAEMLEAAAALIETAEAFPENYCILTALSHVGVPSEPIFEGSNEWVQAWTAVQDELGVSTDQEVFKFSDRNSREVVAATMRNAKRWLK